MDHTFTRTELLIGQSGLDILKNSKVIIFGIGGVGSFTTEALARAGVGHLILVDFDDISISNINRQLHSLHSTVGQPKVEVMKNRIADINPAAKVDTIKEFYSEENADTFLENDLSYVVDAIDTVSSKVHLAKECLKRHIPLISSMGAGNRLTAENYRVADISKTSGDPLAKAMRKLLRQEGITSGIKVVYSPDAPLTPLKVGEEVKSATETKVLIEVGAKAEADSDAIATDATAENEGFRINKRQTPGSISFVPSVVGLLIAGQVIRDLLNYK